MHKLINIESVVTDVGCGKVAVVDGGASLNNCKLASCSLNHFDYMVSQ